MKLNEFVLFKADILLLEFVILRDTVTFVKGDEAVVRIKGKESPPFMQEISEGRVMRVFLEVTFT